ncbi:RAV1 [Candida theae]|uniref:RAV1 n=1 Tax=Candida theae TaxID=1198502 RepID=A0AAD5G0W4_9ASCO|nr:RAV1 [Candida theae]KAI5968444.1 RAV1 [Candida theae]
MTITFIPGEVNRSACSVVQSNWKNHHIIAYGSGNNLIITSATIAPTNKRPNPYNIDKDLQTVYLAKDPAAIDINHKTGVIAVAYDDKLIIYKPLNEYMAIPKWTLAIEFAVKFEVTCLEWACEEDELVIGGRESICLYHVAEQYGEFKLRQRWSSTLPRPVSSICIAPNAKLIMTTSGPYDRLVKVWTRMNYGDDNSQFEVSYLVHPPGTHVVDFHWRRKSGIKSDKVLDGSMAHIRKMRGYVNFNNDEGEVIYTWTSNAQFKVWASYETNGHNQITNWANLDLSECFGSGVGGGDEIRSVLVIENIYLQNSLIPLLKTTKSTLFDKLNLDDFDLLYVISNSGTARIYAVTNITQTPPTNIKFVPVGQDLDLEFGRNEFPHLDVSCGHKLSREYIESEEFVATHLKPVLLKSLSRLNNDERVKDLSFLLHDRVKNTVRFEVVDFKKLLQSNQLGITLINKFQGHIKSIRKLVRSNSLYSSENVVLSISNFAKHNYIWEPMIIDQNGLNVMSITKRFRLELAGDDNSIWDAAIINDIEPPVGYNRRHLVAVVEKSGKLSLWDCDGSINDDQPATQIEVVECHERQPRAFVLTEDARNTRERKVYWIIAVFEKDLIKAWNLELIYRGDGIDSIRLRDQSIANLPQHEEIHQVTRVDAFLSDEKKSLIAVIDKEGLLKSFTLDYKDDVDQLEWTTTCSIPTNVKNAAKINGSTVINKFAVVDGSGRCLSIWDTNQGVLEYEETFDSENGPVTDLDWTFINATTNTNSTTNAILSVGFGRFVLLYTQLRYDYTNKIPTYATIKKIDVSDYTSHEIGDSIWLDKGYLVIGCGNQFFIDDRWIKLGSGTIDSTIRQLMSGYVDKVQRGGEGEDDNDNNRGAKDSIVYDISQLVRVLNGPLPIYHPQFLIQALFMSQIIPVQKILVKLFQALRQGETLEWDLGIDFASEIGKQSEVGSGDGNGKMQPLQRRMSQTFNLDVFTKFNDELADLLSDKLMKVSLPLITRHQQSTLLSVVAIVRELNKYSLTLDENGIRFMIGFKLFQLATKQKELSMRDINWALHSENKEVLLDSVETYYKNRLTWENIKQTGLAYWVKTDRLIKLVESVARNEFGESRDPSGLVSLLYLALRKKQILIGLWRIVNHEEKTKMLKFMSNDFTDARWKSAALKNAFVLLGKHRYMDAAYFFLLADKPYDCCSTLATKVEDISLAIAVAKIYFGVQNIGKESNEVLVQVMEKFVLPRAIENGDRWSTSWVFWQMNDKQMSIQSLIKSPMQMIEESGDRFKELVRQVAVSSKGQSFLRDDPVLVLLFDDLRHRKVDYLKGSLSISPQQEFDFVVRVAMIYSRMGCEYLALLLLRNWTFSQEQKDGVHVNGVHVNGNGAENKNGTRNGQAQSQYGDSSVPNILDSFGDAQLSPTAPSLKNKAPPPAQAFEEPDMSSFNFGF